MDTNDDDQCPLLLGEYIRSNPSSAVSARWIFDLPDDEQGECLASMIENAVYQETWMSYFEYAEKKQIPVTDDIALEAIHAVGLDPYSAPLWLRVIQFCLSEEKKREMFQLALRVPLYQQSAVYGAYKTFELEVAKKNGQTMPSVMPISEVAQYSHLLEMEPTWPDRFVDIQLCSCSQRKYVCSQWNKLLQFMLENYENSCISQDLYLQRIELAFRQMCSQFSKEDACWYAYACFVATNLNDEPRAQEILEKGRSFVGDNSTALCSLNAFFSRSDSASVTTVKDFVRDGLLFQRVYANTANDSLQNRKRFRDVGKTAAANQISDWRIYHQWASAEECVTQDIPMASKVYERGMSCAAKSLKDAILLSNEAIKYHLRRRDEREVLGYAERQIELLSSLQHEGMIRASWNQLVNAELTLGLPSLLKTLRRRAERCTDIVQNSIIERYRVGNYTPCSDEDLDWLVYVDDLMKARKEEQEPAFEGVTPLKRATLPASFFVQPNSVLPDTSLWTCFEMCPNREESSLAQDADEVVGSRTLRGRLVYKLNLDDKTKTRLKREERRRQEKNGGEVDDKVLKSAHSALQTLVEKLEAKKWNATQLRMCRLLSPEWLLDTLTLAELDLRKRRL